MASLTVEQYVSLIPAVKHSPKQYLWSSYDAESDVLYVNFKKPSHADDSELTDDDVIIRYEQGQVVGLTILHTSQRIPEEKNSAISVRKGATPMALDDLKETIETLRERIQTQRPYLEGHETRTRQVLIDPMLRALGWDIENLDSVQLEHTKTKKEWIDYALIGSKGPIAVIEAKALGKPLEDKATDQALNYANKGDIDYMVVTDGDHWQMLDVFKKKVKEGQLADRILMDFQLTRDEPYACALQALGIWRPNLVSGEPPKEAITPVFAHHESATDQPEPSTPEPPSAAPSSGQEAVDSSESEEQNQDNWVPLESLKIKTRKPPANTNIKFSDSSPEPIKHWIDIWVSVATYLIKTRKISEDNCPVRKKKNAKTYLLKTKEDRDDAKFRQIGKLSLFTNFSATNAHKNACWLLKEYGKGVSPSTVLVSTNPS